MRWNRLLWLVLAAVLCAGQLAYAADEGKPKDDPAAKKPAKKAAVETKKDSAKPEAKANAKTKEEMKKAKSHGKPVEKGQADQAKSKGKADAQIAKAKAAAQSKTDKAKLIAKKKAAKGEPAAAKTDKASPQRKSAQEKPARQRHVARGQIKAVDVAGKSITLAVRKGKGQVEDKTYSLADNVKVRIDGQTKTLADVQAGAKGAVRLSEDEKSVVAINIGTRKKPEKTEKPKKP